MLTVRGAIADASSYGFWKRVNVSFIPFDRVFQPLSIDILFACYFFFERYRDYGI